MAILNILNILNISNIWNILNIFNDMYNIYNILHCLYRLDMPMNSGSIIYIPYIQIHHEPSQYITWASMLSFFWFFSSANSWNQLPAKMMRFLLCSFLGDTSNRSAVCSISNFLFPKHHRLKDIPSDYLTVCHGIDGPFIDGLPIQNGDFSMTMLNNQRVYIYIEDIIKSRTN